MPLSIYSRKYTADVFCILDIYVIIVLIFYFFLEPALMGWRLSGFQPLMANKYIVVVLALILRFCNSVIMSVLCTHTYDKTKTAESKIAKLGTETVHHDLAH